jgi:hypothetical protein
MWGTGRESRAVCVKDRKKSRMQVGYSIMLKSM